MNAIKTVIIVYLMLATSCTVVNNLYVNDPVPLEKDSIRTYIGLGSGFVPKIDSISENGTVYHQNKLKLAPNLCFGGQIGLGNQTDLRLAVNLPYIITGFGIRAGVQHSFFKKETPFNMAIGADAGVVFTTDSLFGSNLNYPMQNTLNADVFLPMSYSFSPDNRIILTPRLSYNAFYVRKNIYENKTTIYTPLIPSITVGVKLKRIYIETGIHSVNRILFPNFGISYLIKQ
jgi:hypothetical protein